MKQDKQMTIDTDHGSIKIERVTPDNHESHDVWVSIDGVETVAITYDKDKSEYSVRVYNHNDEHGVEPEYRQTIQAGKED